MAHTHNRRLKALRYTCPVILITLSILMQGCEYVYGRDRGYLTYKNSATRADIYLKVVDDRGMPIEGALIHCDVNIPDWPSQDPNPHQRYRRYKEILETSEDGIARFKKGKLISLIVENVVKPSYTFIYEKNDTGLPVAVKFGYSKQAIATGDYIETSAADPYVLRMERVKEDRSH